MKEKCETPHEINRQYTKYVSMLDRAQAELAAALAELREANRVIELAERALKEYTNVCGADWNRWGGILDKGIDARDAIVAIQNYKGSKP